MTRVMYHLGCPLFLGCQGGVALVWYGVCGSHGGRDGENHGEEKRNQPPWNNYKSPPLRMGIRNDGNHILSHIQQASVANPQRCGWVLSGRGENWWCDCDTATVKKILIERSIKTKTMTD